MMRMGLNETFRTMWHHVYLQLCRCSRRTNAGSIKAFMEKREPKFEGR